MSKSYSNTSPPFGRAIRRRLVHVLCTSRCRMATESLVSGALLELLHEYKYWSLKRVSPDNAVELTCTRARLALAPVKAKERQRALTGAAPA